MFIHGRREGCSLKVVLKVLCRLLLGIYSHKIPEVCWEKEAGWQVERQPQRVSPSRGDLQRSPSISSISCSSSLAFHHQKYFSSVTQPAAATSHSNACESLCRCRSRATLAAVSRKVRVFELALERGRGARIHRCSNRWPRTSERARDWSTAGAAMTSETGVRSAPILAPKRRTTGLADR